MQDIQRGFRGKIGDIFDIAKDIIVSISLSGSGEYDSCCFGIDSSDKLSDEKYMIFYNQTASANREIVLTGSGVNTSYAVNFSKLPSHIVKLVFTVSIDGSGVMGEIKNLIVTISQGSSSLRFSLAGSSFRDEKAVIAVEIYKKEVWRLAAVARGFNGGLNALLKHYGGDEEESPSNTNQSTNTVPVNKNKVSLEKRLEMEAPRLVSLAKPLKVSLEKHKLTNIIAQVVLLIDISGSMSGMFQRGVVQGVVDKLVPLAMQFDDNGEFEFWYFGTHSKRMPAVTIKNYENATANWQMFMRQCGGGTNLSPVIADVIHEYEKSPLPVYVLCVTDGATSNASKVKKSIYNASGLPIFWQFVGIGHGNYGVLGTLDTMNGRIVDNANFFSLDNIESIDTSELYSKMLTEFPNWLKAAKHQQILK